MVKPLGAAAARVERPATIVRILEYMIMVMIEGRSEFVYSMVDETWDIYVQMWQVTKPQGCFLIFYRNLKWRKYSKSCRMV